MDTKVMIWGAAAILILTIAAMIFCLLKMASHADELEEEMLREEGIFYGKD